MSNKEHRFISALLLDGSGAARTLTDSEVDDWSGSDGLLWLDIDQNNKHGRHWLAESHTLSQSARAILLAGETRPRSLVESDGLIVVLRGINMNPGAIPDDMVAARIYMQQNRIITSHRRKILSISDVRDMLRDGNGPKSAGGFLVTLTGCLALRIESAIENIEQMIDDLDARLAGGDTESIRVTLSIVRRQAAAIRRHLAPQRDALDRIARLPAGILSNTEIAEIRDAGDHIARNIEDLDLARENALVTQEELMNRVALEQNARMYLLSIVAAIFLPLTFVSGVLGMNVAGLPGIENPNGFLYSALLMLALGVGLVAYFRWRKWL